MLDSAALINEEQPSIPSISPSPFEQTTFKNTTEARTAISRWLGYPLGRLLPEQLAQVNTIVSESLDKQVVMAQVKQMFELEIIANSGE